jgi:hypothetical protein
MNWQEKLYNNTMAKRSGNQAKPKRTRRGKPGGVSHLIRTEPGYICLTMPILIESEANRRDHWRTKAKRVEKQREEVAIEWRRLVGRVGIGLPCIVKLTRFGVKLLDDDNCANGFKAVRDAIAEIIGVNDGDKRVKWEYGQMIGKVRIYQCQIEVNWEI